MVIFPPKINIYATDINIILQLHFHAFLFMQ